MKRDRLVNLILILFLAVILFTPVGFNLKVFVNQLIQFNPTEIKADERELLGTYHWDLQDSEGRSYDFANAKGEVVFINFWASWCPPCVAEMPDLDLLYKDYSEDVVFLFVARDQRNSAEQFIDKKGYSFPVYYDLGISPSALEPESLPTTFILDQRGGIVVKKKGVAAWNSKATRDLLNKLLRSE